MLFPKNQFRLPANLLHHWDASRHWPTRLHRGTPVESQRLPLLNQPLQTKNPARPPRVRQLMPLINRLHTAPTLADLDDNVNQSTQRYPPMNAASITYK